MPSQIWCNKGICEKNSEPKPGCWLFKIKQKSPCSTLTSQPTCVNVCPPTGNSRPFFFWIFFYVTAEFLKLLISRLKVTEITAEDRLQRTSRGSQERVALAAAAHRIQSNGSADEVWHLDKSGSGSTPPASAPAACQRIGLCNMNRLRLRGCRLIAVKAHFCFLKAPSQVASL